MSNPLPDCPQKDSLVDYLLGKLPESQLSVVENHIADCDSCEDTIRGLGVSDTLTEIASGAFVELFDEGSKEKKLVSDLIDQIKSTPVKPKDPHIRLLEDRAAEVSRLLSATDSADSIGRLAHYEIQSLIGAGSTGVVYMALDEQLDRMVALKILRPSLGDSARERFMAEARLAASIDHPNVITIYQVGVDGDLAYMAMQWVAGETLEDRLQKQSVMKEDAVCALGQQIADGLTAAHAKNLIHRDIKPANIWLTEESDQAKILDFGLARIADDDPQMTATGMLAGTPNFMSPEQTRGLELDGRSDLFSLGCLLYRASTGKLPFGSTGILATLQSIQSDHPRSPKALNPNLSDDFSDLVMCLLEKHPVNRPESSIQLSEALASDRKQWSFKAPNRAAKPTVKTATEGFWGRWIVAATLIGLLAFGGMFWPQIVRVMTDQGELVIETHDADVEIQILGGGEEILVLDTKTKQRVDIKSGEYDIRVKDTRNSFKVSPNRVTMSRGGKETVTITKIETTATRPNTVVSNEDGGSEKSGISGAAANEAETDSRPGQGGGFGLVPKYKGMTFHEWKAKIKNERDPISIQECLVALNQLKDESNEDLLLEDVIAPILRRHGVRGKRFVDSTNPNMDPAITNSVVQAFNNLEPRLVHKFVTNEIREGNQRSREATVTLINHVRQVFGDRIDFTPFMPQIIFEALAHIEKADDDSVQVEMRWLESLTISLADYFGPTIPRFEKFKRDLVANFEMEKQTKIKADLAKLKPWLADAKVTGKISINGKEFTFEELKKQANQWIETNELLEDRKFHLRFSSALILLRLQPDQELFQYATKVLLRKDGPVEERASVYLTFESMEPGNCEPVVKAMMELYEMNDLELEKEVMARTQNGTRLSSRILHSIERYGPVAKTALPWLQEISGANFSEKLERAKSDPDGDKILAFNVARNIAIAIERNRIVVDGGSNAIAPDTRNEIKPPTFNGKSFEQWRTTLKTERNPVIIAEGIEGMAVLADGDEEKIEFLINEVLTPAFRRHGNGTYSDSVNEPGGLMPPMLRSFREMPATRVVKFVKDEIESGTVRSREGLVHVVLLDSMIATRQEKLKELRKAFWEASPELCEALIDTIRKADESEAEKTAVWAINLFGSLMRNLTYVKSTQGISQFDAFGETFKRVESAAESKKGLSQLKAQLVDAAENFMLASVTKDASHTAPSDKLSEMILDPEVPGSIREQIYYLLSNNSMPGEKSVNALWILLYEQEENEILSRIEFGEPKSIIMSYLAAWGKYAEHMLPTLDHIAKGDNPDLAENAEHTANKIREAIKAEN